MYQITRTVNGKIEALNDSNSPNIKQFLTLMDAELMASKLNKNTLPDHLWSVQPLNDEEQTTS
ncbi:hypothetical protein [Alkalicoccobacillus murimartini]|uniref:Uncharacterized protein n=1 Tax=Alkalicoccobacillus murimartini TaxID=171685 RepID=A0ABT9YLZ6_9BACI|nr:hypothetical protein [Alkalicoccobacillus murimartini]MDQ0208893.1 hypothetical protein [Alkalicoccobacillus murimartini]